MIVRFVSEIVDLAFEGLFDKKNFFNFEDKGSRGFMTEMLSQSKIDVSYLIKMRL